MLAVSCARSSPETTVSEPTVAAPQAPAAKGRAHAGGTTARAAQGPRACNARGHSGVETAVEGGPTCRGASRPGAIAGSERTDRATQLMMMVLSLLQDDDQALASAIVSSGEAIWGLLSDPKKFATLQD